MLVTTTYLQQLSPAELRPSRRALPATARVERVLQPTTEFSRFLYQAVGAEWNWTDRLPLGREEWRAIVAAPGCETWVLWVDGTPAGYAELQGRAAPDAPGTEVELVYFGLLPDFIGAGLGGPLLTEALRHAWALDGRWEGFGPVERVWVHTCSLDGPTALTNYRARGMEVYRSVEEEAEVKDASAALWPARPSAGQPA